MTGRRRWLWALVGVAISAAALVVVAATVDLRETSRILADARPLPLVAIVAVVAVQVTVRAWRWSFLMPHGADGRRLRVRRLVPPLLVGYLGNAVLPARLGEPMRAVLASRRERVGTTEALGSVLLERLVDVATLAVVAFTAAMLVDAPGWISQLLGVAAAGGVVGMAILVSVGIQPILALADRFGLARRPGLRSQLVRFAASVGGPSRRRAIGISAAVSTGAWLLDALSFWLAAQAVGVELAYPAALLIAGFTVLGTAVPSAPGYVGTFELAAAAAAGALGVPPAEALAMAVIAHVMTLAPMALGGAASLPIVGTSLAAAAGDVDGERGLSPEPEAGGLGGGSVAPAHREERPQQDIHQP